MRPALAVALCIVGRMSKWLGAVLTVAACGTLIRLDLTASIVPDVAGTYTIELRVFDGELWSAPLAKSLVVR